MFFFCSATDFAAQAPLCIQSNAPLEGVHQFFKWGAKYVVVTDYDGDCKCLKVSIDAFSDPMS